MEKYLYIVILLFVIVSCNKEKITVGKQIEGDFNGDGKDEIASVKSRIMNDSLKMTEYSIEFSDSTMEPKSTQISNYKIVRLINEGDLNDDKADDISISYEQDESFPISIMETRSYKANWKKIIYTFSMHGGKDTLNSQQLQNIVTKKEDSLIYFTYGDTYEFDKNFKLKTKRIRKAIKIK